MHGVLKRVFGVEDFGITRASIPCWGPVGSRASAKNKQEAIQSTQTRNPKLLMGLTVPKPLNSTTSCSEHVTQLLGTHQLVCSRAVMLCEGV